MSTLHIAFFLYFLVLITGLFSALAARLGEGSRHQTACQRVFLISLTLVGLTTIITLTGAPGAWLGAGATFSIMVVGTTCDFSQSRRAVS